MTAQSVSKIAVFPTMTKSVRYVSGFVAKAVIRRTVFKTDPTAHCADTMTVEMKQRRTLPNQKKISSSSTPKT